MKSLLIKGLYILASIKDIPSFHIWDKVKYRGETYLVNNNTRSDGIELVTEFKHVLAPRSEVKRIYNLRTIKKSFSSTFRFLKLNWFKIHMKCPLSIVLKDLRNFLYNSRLSRKDSQPFKPSSGDKICKDDK